VLYSVPGRVAWSASTRPGVARRLLDRRSDGGRDEEELC